MQFFKHRFCQRSLFCTSKKLAESQEGETWTEKTKWLEGAAEAVAPLLLTFSLGRTPETPSLHLKASFC